MGYIAKFMGWNNLSLEDLIVAYRKAKADCFFEKILPNGIKFAEYEQNLIENLNKLLSKLQNENGFYRNENYLGEFRVVPKKLDIKPKTDTSNGHVHFSDAARSFKSLVQYNELIPEFRIIGDFPIDTHIISALWINMVGHKFDNSLSESCYGFRLKRVSNDFLNDKAQKDFHLTAINSFVPYIYPYQKWRNDGLIAIRDELKKNRDVIAVSFDLKSYYHFIDPMIIASEELQETLGIQKELTSEDKEFTLQLAKFLKKWSIKSSEFSKEKLSEGCKITGGLAIGLTATQIISNVLLYKWDNLIKEKIAPIHYGRYVDDMFLVLTDTGTIENTTELMEYLQTRLSSDFLIREKNSDGNGSWTICLGKHYQKDSLLQLQENKQKLFILQGQAGLDLLDNIEKEIDELSSEHRLMPSPDDLDESIAVRVLSASGDVSEQADTLRRADGLTIRRLSWSLHMRHMETLAKDLHPHEW